ncbi:MAG: PAS domain S-box protein, partial [Anaerolineae bacterium]
HVLRDIGERANMDQEHNEAETFLNNLLHNMPDAVAVIGRDYTIRDANDRFIALYGPPEATREDITGKRCYEVTHRASAPCDEEGHSCPLRDILQNRYRPSAYRHVHRTARGEKRTLELAVLPLIGPQGEIEGIIEIHHDVTERERLRADLARRESQLRATLYSIGDAVIATDKEGRVVMMNPVAEKLTGWSEGEALGKPLKEIFHILNEETRAPVEDPVTRVLREGIVIGLGNHTLLLTRDGREVPIADAGAPILDSEGEIAGVVLVFRDQTEERRAQRAVEEARQLAEGVVETVRDPLIVLDADLRVVSANRAFYRLFQTTPEATEGRPFYELDEGQWNIPELRRLLEEILPQNTELEGFRLEHAFARIGRRILLLNARRLQHEKEGTRLILLVIEDVTERARAEQQLRESEERYRDLVENSLQLICTHDLEGRLLSVNRAGVQIMGYNSAEELIGRNIRDFLSPDVRHLFDDYLQTIRRKGSASGLMRVRTANGEERIWEYHNTLRTEGVEQPVVRGLAYDITDRVRAEQQLRESEAQYRSLFEDVPEIIYSLSPEGHFTALNPAFERVTGWSVEEWLGKPFDELIHPQDRALARREFRRALRGETREFRPMRVLTKDGETITLEVLGVAQVHEGRTVGVTGFAHDITDRVRAEQQLRESEERFRTYVEQANDFIFVLDPKGRLTFVNQAICEALDCREEDLLGQPATALVAPEARPLAEQALRRVWSGETVRRVVLPVRRPDGRQLLVEIRGRAFYHQGRLSHTLHIARDVTAQVRAEQALRASEKRYRNLVDSLPILIYALSKEGTFTFLNPAFETITGWPVDEWLGRPFEDLVLPEDLPLARERFARALKTTQTRTTITLRIRTAWGEPRVMEVLGVGRVEDGEITAVTGFAHDITDRVRHQREIEALAQLAQVVGETTALQPLLERILEIACQAIPAAEKGSILLREPDGSLRIRALHRYRDPPLY